jgi:sporulation related protein
MPGEPVTVAAAAVASTGVVAGAVPWTVEVASVNTINGAMARVRQALDSLPVPTFAASRPGGGSVTWYRLLAGAFSTSEQAAAFLNTLRQRGSLGPAAGKVVQAPLAWLLEENVTEDQLSVRLFGWRQQGLPAYALIDPAGTSRIYFGAFENEAEARLLTPTLDSLNLYATLVTRIGSVR